MMTTDTLSKAERIRLFDQRIEESRAKRRRAERARREAGKAYRCGLCLFQYGELGQLHSPATSAFFSY